MENSQQSAPMFDNPFLEKMSRTNVWVVITAFIVISASVFSYGFFREELNILTGIICFLSGFIFFTLSEYMVHRFVYHSGTYTDKKRWQFKIHGFHHAFPRDKERLAMPLTLAILLACLFFLLFRLIMGKYAWFFSPGFISGFAFYQFVHYTIHMRRPPKNRLQYWWKHHHIHHYRESNRAYGVTSPLWDMVFGTMPSKSN